MNEKAVKLLQELVNRKYGKIEKEKVDFNDDEFNYEFKSEIKVSENDFESLEKELSKDNLFVKLLRISGVYVDGNANNEMIDRISGKAFISIKELEEYNQKVAAAKERDHRKIGHDLDLFCFSDYVGGGLPLFTPRGTVIIDALKREIEKVCRKYGFEKVSCP